MNDTVSCPTPELDTRTVNDFISERIAHFRNKADEMESKLAAMPAELLDLRVADLADLGIYL